LHPSTAIIPIQRHIFAPVFISLLLFAAGGALVKENHCYEKYFYLKKCFCQNFRLPFDCRELSSKMEMNRFCFQNVKERNLFSEERIMTDNVLIVLSCGTDNPNRSTRALFFAQLASKQGKNVSVFLLDEGVYLAKKGIADHIQAATGDSADDHLTYLREFEIPILVCTPCAVARKITEEDLIEGSRLATGDQLIELSCKSAVLSF